MLKKLNNIIKGNKKTAIISTAVGLSLMATQALAVETIDTASVIANFTQIKTDILTIAQGIIPVAVSIFALKKAFAYGKQFFATGSK